MPEGMKSLMNPKSPLFKLWLIILPIFYIISPACLLGISFLLNLSKSIKYILIIFIILQIVASIFSNDPVHSLIWSLVRISLTLGLIGIGQVLKKSDDLYPVGFGLAFSIIFSVFFTIESGVDITTQRIAHPYMTSTTIGLAGAILIWLGIFGKGNIYRLSAFILIGGIGLIFSGSRGALLAALFGCILPMILKGSIKSVVTILILFISAGLFLSTFSQKGIESFSRLLSVQDSGRSSLWYEVFSLINFRPIFGIGQYQLGSYVQKPTASCPTFGSTSFSSDTCKILSETLGAPWLIAHNMPLQEIVQLGIFGSLGIFLIVLLGLTGAFQNKDYLSIAILGGSLIFNSFDNSLFVPSPFSAEIFWILVGSSLNKLKFYKISNVSLVSSGILISIMLMPIIVFALSMNSEFARASAEKSFSSFYLSKSDKQNSSALTKFYGPNGEYEASLFSCSSWCLEINSENFTILNNEPTVVYLSGFDWRRNAHPSHLEIVIFKNGLVVLREILK